MNNTEDILKKLNEMDCGSSEYHYLLADYWTDWAKDDPDEESRKIHLERAAMHKGIGDRFNEHKQ